MKKKKNLIIEFIILITITISIGIIFYIYKQLSDIKPEESTTNEIPNYSLNKNVKIKKNLSDALTTFNIPEQQFIIEDNSTYDFFIISTDNAINTISELITIEYDIYNSEFNKDNLTNFCNSYNDIESSYRLTCKFEDKNIKISNFYYLNKIYTDKIKTHKYEFNFPVKNNDKLNEYLEELKKEQIQYEIVEDIK